MTQSSGSLEEQKRGTHLRQFLISCLCSLLTSALFLFCSSALAQTPAEVQAEPPKPALKIAVTDNLLSVEASDAEFGTLIKEISEKAKFSLEISSSVSSKRISTNFKEIDIEKGIRRLLSIIREKDYTISYNQKGLIDKLVIYGGGSINKTAPSTGTAPRRVPPRPILPSAAEPRRVPPPAPVIPPAAINATPPVRPKTLQSPQKPQQPEQPVEEVLVEEE